MTVLDLIGSSMRLFGARETPDAEEAQDALAILNEIVDDWGNERLTMYTSSRAVFPIAAGQQVYLIGPSGADWTAPRPPYFDNAGLLLLNSDPTQDLERPIKILTRDEFRRERIKSLQSTLPTKLYYQPDSPNGTVWLWPAPTQANQIAIYTPTAITQFTSIHQTISFPPGYQRTLRYALAVAYAPEFGRECSPSVQETANDTKTSLKRKNLVSQVGRLRCDPAMRSHGGRFDVLLGEER
jgi:hypothetical protein